VTDTHENEAEGMSTTTRGHYDDLTRDELYELAQERDLPDRSTMDRDQLQAALELDDVGPNAVDMLLGHHREVRRLFEAIEELSDRPSKRKEELVAELVVLLSKHAEVEEQVFYPAVREEVGGQQDEIDESMEEHHAADLLLSELDGMPSDATRYDMKVHVLAEHMLHHLEEEEEDLFPTVREALPERRLREIGAGMVAVWEVAPPRPHPSAPQTPPGNVLLALPTAVWDLAVSVTRVVRRRVLGR
jgi:hemerythrin superfamily protein